MDRLLSWLCAWVLYGLGHTAFLVADRSWIGHAFYQPLNHVWQTLMALSVDVQGDGPGPWFSADPDHG